MINYDFIKCGFDILMLLSMEKKQFIIIEDCKVIWMDVWIKKDVVSYLYKILKIIIWNII